MADGTRTHDDQNHNLLDAPALARAAGRFMGNPGAICAPINNALRGLVPAGNAKMANNRMFLVHIPTGLAAPLGKRMSWGWYTGEQTRQTMGDLVSLLFEMVALGDYDHTDRQDDFAVALEVATGATMATGAWRYGMPRADGLIQLEMDPPEAAGEPRDGESNG